MAKTICLAQSKGGTGKTSSTLNIGAALAEKGYKVLACDLDQQASLTVSLGVNPVDYAQANMKQLLTEPGIKAQDLIVETQEGIDLIPSHVSLAMVEYRMPNVSREKQLSRKLKPLHDRYDYILLDTAPSLGIATLNALSAADYVTVPTQPEPLCVYGLYMLQDTIDEIRSDANPVLEMLGFFITFYDARVKGHREMEKQLREEWPDRIFKTVIKRRPSMLETTMEGRSILYLKSDSELATEYRALTEEVIKRANQ